MCNATHVRLEEAVAFAERESAQAYAAHRRAWRDFTEADTRLLDARLNLADALAEASTTDTERKARP